ncbi:uncharacterized protein LOC123318972 isoform X1 [Coccinella septempunctata]|uniref:uncharacterized protein LOC123318972 isoform X1 n=1 Tax=Coccinella septempunctata TaxID=41139 RepID=UPI001D0707B7|nr:uncharacterized protein LOC123318972 isoform X1 [Coccinella septempunctata]
MKFGLLGAPPPLVLVLLFWALWGGASPQGRGTHRGADEERKYGDRCNETEPCSFEGSFCDKGKCYCRPEFPVTNQVDKCGEAVRVNESCFFNEQCETVTPQTECRDGVCICRFEKIAVLKSDGKVECEVPVQTSTHPGKYVDPAMIGILVAMFFMFITICVVLRLFSRARWRENRTIFNTPNPRLMNVSLLRENKLLHGERRGSKTSMRGPSRQPSMASLRPHSPNSQGRLFLGSRRGSRGSSNASAVSNRSSKSPPQNAISATTPMLESIQVEIQQPK